MLDKLLRLDQEYTCRSNNNAYIPLVVRALVADPEEEGCHELEPTAYVVKSSNVLIFALFRESLSSHEKNAAKMSAYNYYSYYCQYRSCLCLSSKPGVIISHTVLCTPSSRVYATKYKCNKNCHIYTQCYWSQLWNPANYIEWVTFFWSTTHTHLYGFFLHEACDEKVSIWSWLL